MLPSAPLFPASRLPPAASPGIIGRYGPRRSSSSSSSTGSSSEPEQAVRRVVCRRKSPAREEPSASPEWPLSPSWLTPGATDHRVPSSS